MRRRNQQEARPRQEVPLKGGSSREKLTLSSATTGHPVLLPLPGVKSLGMVNPDCHLDGTGDT
jgi:hypothetical protein